MVWWPGGEAGREVCAQTVTRLNNRASFDQGLTLPDDKRPPQWRLARRGGNAGRQDDSDPIL